eukprot:7378961-Prymnesium_polylepis.1
MDPSDQTNGQACCPCMCPYIYSYVTCIPGRKPILPLQTRFPAHFRRGLPCARVGFVAAGGGAAAAVVGGGTAAATGAACAARGACGACGAAAAAGAAAAGTASGAPVISSAVASAARSCCASHSW